jgi:hypothetical protein
MKQQTTNISAKLTTFVFYYFMKSPTFNITLLSTHLFWDVDIRTLTFEDHKQFIVKRILEYGLFSDWTLLNQYLNVDEIADIVENIKDLDQKSLSFVSTISKRPKEKFLCYTTQRSMPRHWNF